MTSSERSNSDGWIASPSALAAIKLMTSSSLVACWTGGRLVGHPSV